MAYDWLNYPGTLTLPDNTTFVAGAAGNAVSPNFWTAKLTWSGTIEFHDATNTWELATTSVGGAARLHRTGLDTAILNIEAEFEGIGSNPSGGNIRLFEFRNLTDSTYVGKLSINTTGKLVYENAANATVFTSTNSIPTGAGWRVWAGVEKGTTTSNGKIRVKLYTASDGHGATALETYTTDAGNTGTGNIGGVYMGWGSGGTATLRYRYAEMNSTTLAEIGPYTPSTLTVDFSRYVKQVIDFSTSTGTGVYIDSTSQTSGPSISTAIDNTNLLVTFADSAGRTSPIELDVTVMDGASNSETVSVTVPPNVRRVGPLVKISGAWV